MQVLEVGKPYPLHNRATGDDKVVLQRTDSFFDVLYYSTSALADAPVWCRGPLRVGLAEPAPGVPFVLFAFPNEWEFDVTLNLRKADTDAQRRAWLDSPATLVSLCLINARTNVLAGLRVVSLPAGMAQQLREVLRRQLALFPHHHEEVDEAFRVQDRRTDLPTLLARTPMVTLGG